MLEWISNNSSLVQAIAATVQVLIAALMLWTLIQNSRTTEIVKRQLESSVDPVMEVTMLGPKLSLLRLKNEGSVDLCKLEKAAIIAAHFDMITKKVTNFQISSSYIPLAEQFTVGHATEIDLSKHLIPVGVEKPKHSLDAYCFVLRYRRAADMRPFAKTIPFALIPNAKDPNETSFFPLFPVRSGAIGDSGSEDFFGDVKKELIELYEKRVKSE